MQTNDPVQNIWIVIPSYNEESRIGKVLDEVLTISSNVLVVDDGSIDNTSGAVKSRKVKLLMHKANRGKGAALRTGCDHAFDTLGASHVIVIDSDGQHDPAEIPMFFGYLEENDIVFGSRERDHSMSVVFRFGNWFISSVAYLLSGIRLRDTQSGFRAFSREAYEKIRWKANGYSVESEMILRAGKAGLTYKEIEIRSLYHDAKKGTTVKDGVMIVVDMIRLWVRRVQ